MPMFYKIKVQLCGLTKPPVWRRFLIPRNASFADFNRIIMTGFGWEMDNSYKFTFCFPHEQVTIYDKAEEVAYPKETAMFFENEPWIIANRTAICQQLKPTSAKMDYEYFNGQFESWFHKITLEDAYMEDIKECFDPTRAHCIAGRGKCPPEGYGDIYDYEELKKKLIANPKHAAHALELLELYESHGWKAEELINRNDRSLFLDMISYGRFFDLIDGKVDFSKIDLKAIERAVSDIQLHPVPQKIKRYYRTL